LSRKIDYQLRLIYCNFKGQELSISASTYGYIRVLAEAAVQQSSQRQHSDKNLFYRFDHKR